MKDKKNENTKELIKKNEKLKETEEIYKIYRKEWDFDKDGILNISVITMGNDYPYAYEVTLRNDSMTNALNILLFVDGGAMLWKGKMIRERYEPTYYQWKSDDISFDPFKYENATKFSQEDLAKLANKDWKTYKNYKDSKVNNKLVKIFKDKFIKRLEYYKQIKYVEKLKKYIPYDLYEMFKDNYDN